MPSELINEMWYKREQVFKVDGWVPFDVLASVEEKTLLKAVRQRGRVADLYKCLEGIVRRANSPGNAEVGAMHRLIALVSSFPSEKTVDRAHMLG